MRLALIAGLTAAGLASSAGAQVVAPMNLRVGSVSERFIAKLIVSNPYPDARTFQVVAYDQDRKEIEVWTAAPTVPLLPGKSRQIMIAVPFEGQAKRDILACVEARIVQADGGRLRAQVCSTVSGVRYSSSS